MDLVRTQLFSLKNRGFSSEGEDCKVRLYRALCIILAFAVDESSACTRVYGGASAFISECYTFGPFRTVFIKVPTAKYRAKVHLLTILSVLGMI